MKEGQPKKCYRKNASKHSPVLLIWLPASFCNNLFIPPPTIIIDMSKGISKLLFFARKVACSHMANLKDSPVKARTKFLLQKRIATIRFLQVELRSTMQKKHIMKGKGISPLLATVLKLLSFRKKVACSQRKYYTKGISPLLATVLLVAMTVATTTMLSGWVSTTMGTTQTTISNRTSEGVACAAAEIVIDDVYSGAGSGSIARAIVRNSGMTDNLAITSAQLYDRAGNNFTTVNALPAGMNRGQQTTFSFNYSILPATTNDSAHGINNGTRINGLAWTLGGKYGSALNFDGADDYINISRSASLNISDNVTIVLYAKPSSSISQNSFDNGDSKQTLIDDGVYTLYFDRSTGKVNFEVDNVTSNAWMLENGTNSLINSAMTGVVPIDVFNNKIFFGGSWCSGCSLVYSFNGTNWTFENGTNSPSLDTNLIDVSAGATYRSKIYFGSGRGPGYSKFYSFDGENWTVINSSMPAAGDGFAAVQSMAVYNDKLYIGLTATSQAYLYSYNGNTLTLENSAGSPTNNNSFTRVNSMAVYKGKLYLGMGWGTSLTQVYSYDGTTWTHENGTNSPSGNSTYSAIFTLNVYKDRLYATTGYHWQNDGTADVYSFDGSTWTVENGTGSPTNNLVLDHFSGTAVYNGRIYFGAGNGAGGNATLFSFDGSTWSTENGTGFLFDDSRYRSVGAGKVFNGKMYITGSRHDTAPILYSFVGKNQLISSNRSSWSSSWYSIAAAYNTSVMNLYTDGILTATQSTTGVMDVNKTGSLYIGNSYGNSVFNGIIDDVAIWNRTLTNAEINTSMTSPLSVSNTNDLVGYWKFDEGKGVLSCPSDFSRVVVTTNCGGVSAEFTKSPKC